MHWSSLQCHSHPISTAERSSVNAPCHPWWTTLRRQKKKKKKTPRLFAKDSGPPHHIFLSRGGVCVLPRTRLQVCLPSVIFSASTPNDQAIHPQAIQGPRAPSHILVLADSHGILHHRRQWCSLLRSEPHDPCPATPPTNLGTRSRHCVVTKSLANQAGD
ncbi:hypothetical protein CGRA01v4_09614 [Colletotrichum graminicola]|nr:hypothetical protein CGRA01v4_09614 [Colletotrichum graminicola]